MIDKLKKTPKILKETNSKLTLEQTQSLFGAMLTAKEDRFDFCIAYSAYYKKPIVVVYPKSYRVFSPLSDMDITEEEVILLYASKTDNCKTISYTSEKNLTKDILKRIMETKVAGPLKAQSNYKTAELDEIAAKLHIETKVSDKKRRKKEDIYNDIRVAIHNDQM